MAIFPPFLRDVRVTADGQQLDVWAEHKITFGFLPCTLQVKCCSADEQANLTYPPNLAPP